MNDWSVIMINANAEMKNKTKEEITQIVMKELGMRQNAINARLKDKPVHTHKNALIVMIAQARYQAVKRINSIRDRRQTD